MNFQLTAELQPEPHILTLYLEIHPNTVAFKGHFSEEGLKQKLMNLEDIFEVLSQPPQQNYELGT